MFMVAILLLVSLLFSNISAKFGAEDVTVTEKFTKKINTDALEQFILKPNSLATQKSIAELQLPNEFIMLTVKRKGDYLKARGFLILEVDDVVLIHCYKKEISQKTINKFIKSV